MSGFTLALPGDWSSARLLVRILATIDADWSLDESGLVDRETDDRCTLQMGPADAALPARCVAEEDPVYPSFTDEDVAALGEHRAVLRLRADPSLPPQRAALALLRCGGALIDAGAKAVVVAPSGLAHSAERWQQLAALVDETPGLALGRAFVRLLVRDGERWSTRGLVTLGHREVVVDGDVAEAYAFEVTQALTMRLLDGPGLVGGERLQAGRAGPKLRVDPKPDAYVVTRER